VTPFAENRARILQKHWRADATPQQRLKEVEDSTDDRDFQLTSKDVQNLREMLARLEFKRDSSDTASVLKRVRAHLLHAASECSVLRLRGRLCCACGGGVLCAPHCPAVS